jgi:hypothetical protein
VRRSLGTGLAVIAAALGLMAAELEAVPRAYSPQPHIANR